MPHVRDHFDDADLLVTGTGAAGSIALAAARAAGVDAVGVDLRQPEADLPAGAHGGVRAWGIFGDGTVACSTADGTRRLQPRVVIVATGAIALPLPLPGWERAGVAGPFSGAQELPAGTQVTVVRDPHANLAGRAPDLGLLDVVADIDLASTGPVSIDGDDRVTAVTVDGRTIPTRYVLLDNGVQPENVNARMTGVLTVFSANAGGDAIGSGLIVALQRALLTEADRSWAVPMTARPPATGITIAELASLVSAQG